MLIHWLLFACLGLDASLVCIYKHRRTVPSIKIHNTPDTSLEYLRMLDVR